MKKLDRKLSFRSCKDNYPKKWASQTCWKMNDPPESINSSFYISVCECVIRFSHLWKGLNVHVFNLGQCSFVFPTSSLYACPISTLFTEHRIIKIILSYKISMLLSSLPCTFLYMIKQGIHTSCWIMACFGTQKVYLYFTKQKEEEKTLRMPGDRWIKVMIPT